MVTWYEKLGEPRIIREYTNQGKKFVELDIYEGATLPFPKDELHREFSGESIEKRLEFKNL